MKTIYLSLALLIPTSVVFSNINHISSFLQSNIIQLKLKNDTNTNFVYYVDGTKYEIEPMKTVGLSFAENTSVKSKDSKTNKEKEIIVMSSDKNGTSLLVSEIKK